MRIESAALSMQSQHAAVTRHEERETLRAWVGRQAPDPVAISDAGRAAQSAEAQAVESAGDAVAGDPDLILIRIVIEMLTGRSVRVFDASALRAAEPLDAPPAPPAPPAPAPRQAGFGIEYEYRAVREESERTDFSVGGVVRTADGQEFAFRLELSMERHFREETSVGLLMGEAVRKDPLVINLPGGSGYLALDHDGNGRIDADAELFGPRTGSGFGELAALDADGNGWIDDGDPAFGRLLVWTPADGAPSTLKERNVGALFLGHVETPFELRGDGNADLGAVRASGLYLTEAGQAGALQEIDLTV